MRVFGFIAAVFGCALAAFALELYGIGAFCFEESWLTLSLSGRTISVPDCFITNSGSSYNLKALVACQLIVALLLTAAYSATAVGLIASRSRSKPLVTYISLTQIAFFVAVRFASSAFSGEASIGMAASCLLLIFSVCSLHAWRVSE